MKRKLTRIELRKGGGKAPSMFQIAKGVRQARKAEKAAAKAELKADKAAMKADAAQERRGFAADLRGEKLPEQHVRDNLADIAKNFQTIQAQEASKGADTSKMSIIEKIEFEKTGIAPQELETGGKSIIGAVAEQRELNQANLDAAHNVVAELHNTKQIDLEGPLTERDMSSIMSHLKKKVLFA